MRSVEILAPAGSYEGMKAAMNAGCDAVYIGGSSFGARAYADNLKEDMLLRAIDETHIRDKKLYLTVNTLVKEKELTDRLYQFLEKYYLEGLDAVIVQDVGAMHFIHRNFPDLPIHASTQMTLTMAQGAELLKDCGVTRLVTSRELSLEEIRNIRDNTDLEIETFVHGALCYCYSGQCLMSSMIGGRSGNRGRCAQPCRMPYQFYVDNRRLSANQEKYLLSPKDINTIAIIPELVEAGIDSFKIEGRMKRPEYAAAVASIYRKYVDLYFAQGKEQYRIFLTGDEFRQDMILLQDVYNRGGFSQGYAKTCHGKSMMSLYRPNHSGVCVGEVSDRKGREVSIRPKEKINAQDILEIRHREEEGYEFTVKDSHKKGEVLKTVIGIRRDAAADDGKPRDSHTLKAALPSIQIGDPVYRTRNNELMDTLAKKYMGEDRKLGIRGHLTAKSGEKLSLTVSYKSFTATACKEIVQEAVKQPMTQEKLKAPLEKTGGTLYYFEDLTIDTDDHSFVPVAWLNEIRREVLTLLEEVTVRHYQRKLKTIKADYCDNESMLTGCGQDMAEGISAKTAIINLMGPEKKEGTIGISVAVQTEEQLEAALHFPEVTRIIADYDRFETGLLLEMALRTGSSGKSFYLALPYICRLPVYDRLKQELYGILDNECVHGFLVKNFEEIALLRSLSKDRDSKKDIILNYNMYVFNKEARSFWNERGITSFTAPVELNYQELRTLGLMDCEMLVYGYVPLMISAQCLLESTAGCRKCIQSNTGYLTDRMDRKFFVQTNCSSCYNIIYNGQPLALHKQESEITGLKPAGIRLDFSLETPQQMERILRVFVDTYRYGRKDETGLSDYTTGHFKRGVE